MTLETRSAPAAASDRGAGAPATVGAAVDLGSISVHLVVGAIEDGGLRPILDESAFLGLGAAVDATGMVGRAARAELVATLAAYVATSRGLGADEVTLMGTEPLRRAGDAARIALEVEAATGVPLHVLTHEEEALLTLLGVTEGRIVREPMLVFDIGGGSSEFAAVGPGRPPRASGIRIGSNRLTARAGTQDPPTRDDIERMRELARDAMTAVMDERPSRIVAVGGTATNMLKVTAAGVADRRLDRGRLAETLEVLQRAPSASIAAQYALKPTRARLLAAGSVILEAVLDRYGVDGISVSGAGLREGAILVAARAGRGWRDRLTALASGWRD